MRCKRIVWCAVLMFVVVGLASARASDQDETVLTVQVSAADHEAVEGYFALGDTTTVMAKPGSELYRFLARQRGHSVRVTLTPADERQLSRVRR